MYSDTNPKLSNRVRLFIAAEILILLSLLFALFTMLSNHNAPASSSSPSNAKKYIKWVDFDVTADAMHHGKEFCPSHRIRESELDARVQQYAEELRIPSV